MNETFKTVSIPKLSFRSFSKESGVIEVTDENFDQLISKEKGVTLVDFYAEFVFLVYSCSMFNVQTNLILFFFFFFSSWCGPCRSLSPILNEISKELNIKVMKINCDDNREIPGKFQVRSFLFADVLFFVRSDLLNTQNFEMIRFHHFQQL